MKIDTAKAVEQYTGPRAPQAISGTHLSTENNQTVTSKLGLNLIARKHADCTVAIVSIQMKNRKLIDENMNFVNRFGKKVMKQHFYAWEIYRCKEE